MISFRTIATMAKWDCQTIVATTEGGGIERERALVCHLSEGGREGRRQSRRHKCSEVSMQKRTSLAAAVTHSRTLILGVGADLARGIP